MNSIKDILGTNNALLFIDPINQIISLIIGFIISLIIVYHYKKFSSSLTNRVQLTKIFPILVLILILIVSIIKTSIALSLGLVGALSIIRFRTPIKEPEELMYLFLCIAVGISIGSGQTTISIISTLLILFLTGLYKFKFNKNVKDSIILNINIEKIEDPLNKFKIIENIIKEQTKDFVVKRFDIDSVSLNAILILDIKTKNSLINLIHIIKEEVPNCSLSVIDQNELLIP